MAGAALGGWRSEHGLDLLPCIEHHGHLGLWWFSLLLCWYWAQVRPLGPGRPCERWNCPLSASLQTVLCWCHRAWTSRLWDWIEGPHHHATVPRLKEEALVAVVLSYDSSASPLSWVCEGGSSLSFRRHCIVRKQKSLAIQVHCFWRGSSCLSNKIQLTNSFFKIGIWRFTWKFISIPYGLESSSLMMIPVYKELKLIFW